MFAPVSPCFFILTPRFSASGASGWKIFSSTPNTAAPGSAASCCGDGRARLRARAAAASSGRCSTGTRRPSASTSRWARRVLPDWRIARVTGDALARLAERWHRRIIPRLAPYESRPRPRSAALRFVRRPAFLAHSDGSTLPRPRSTSTPTSGRCASSRNRRESFAVRKNVAQPWSRRHRPRRDGDRLRRRRLRLRGDRRHCRRRPARRAASARRAWARGDRALRAGRFARRCRGPRRAATMRRRRSTRRCRRGANGTTCCSANRSEPAAIRGSSTGKRWSTCACDASPRHQRRRRRACSVTASCIRRSASPRTRTASRSSARSTAIAASASRAASRSSRASASPAAGRRIADEALELLAAPNCPSGRDGRAARARPDGAADPRVDRPSARARPHPRRRAQFRRHELRHARHVRHATATAPSCSTSRSIRRGPRSSRATRFDDDGTPRGEDAT